MPVSDWQLEVRMRWVRAPPPATTTIGELFEAHPLKTKLYSVGLLCSPRWALLWAWAFDREPGLRLLQTHIAQHQARARAARRGAARRGGQRPRGGGGALTRPARPARRGAQAAVAGRIKGVLSALAPELLPDALAEAAAAEGSPLQRLGRALGGLDAQRLWWWAWLLCPGLQTAYLMFFFAARSPIKLAYAGLIGGARTVVELLALVKCAQALCRRNRRAVVHSLLCCYLLPLIMTVQSLAVLLLLGVFLPSWIVHICVVAFCLWGPPVMIALMTTAWQPQRGAQLPGVAEAPAGAPAGAGAAGAVDAMAALVGAGGAGGVWGAVAAAAAPAPAASATPHWPKPLQVPEAVEESCVVPSYFVCPITHSVMTEPAVTATGATYERAAIVEWLRSQRRDPLTGRPLAPEQVSPNLALWRAIEEWLDARRRGLEAAAAQGGGATADGSSASAAGPTAGAGAGLAAAAALAKQQQQLLRKRPASRRGSTDAGGDDQAGGAPPP
ncbi:PUB35 [Scenedesmus sp. PABB004]|nr:PUB35 [Scenedesmus sp. PABB004]